MKITIIIPVYNAEKYLHKCINSILRQDFEDFELLLINDGSTDNSGEICDQYKIQDKRINVFHQINSGVSAARNKGIDNARGEWITFVDSDDYIENNYFETLKYSIDSDWIFLNIDREINNEIITSLKFKNQKLNISDFIKKYSLYPHFPGPYAKFFKTNYIRENKLRYNINLKYGEDAVFNINYMNYCKTIFTTGSSTYIYRDTENGLSKLKYDINNDYELYEEIKEALLPYKATEFYNKSILFPLSRTINVMYYDNQLLVSERKNRLMLLIKEHFNIIIQIYCDPKIKPLVIFSYYTGFYGLLDFVFSKIKK